MSKSTGLPKNQILSYLKDAMSERDPSTMNTEELKRALAQAAEDTAALELDGLLSTASTARFITSEELRAIGRGEMDPQTLKPKRAAQHPE
jgi:hypothetical protein